MTHPTSGTSYLFRGFKLLNHPKLRLFVYIPLTINSIIFAVLLGFSIHWFGNLITWIDHFLPSWLHWLNWLLWIFFALATLLAITYLFTIIANLIAAPFNGLLAEKTEELLTKKPVSQDSSFNTIIKDLPRVLKHEGQKILYYLPRALLCLILFIVPLIQIAAPFLWFLFNSWMMSLEYLDYPMDNHKLELTEIRVRMGKRKLENLNFGMLVMVCTMIPIVNFIVMPAAVIGATIFWVEEYQHDQ